MEVRGGTNNSKHLNTCLQSKDNINRNLEFYEQSGNQIAGIDFSYKINSKNNFIFMVNILGEDGLDQFIDDGWIGAIFPSKDLEMYGISN